MPIYLSEIFNSLVDSEALAKLARASESFHRRNQARNNSYVIYEDLMT